MMRPDDGPGLIQQLIADILDQNGLSDARYALHQLALDECLRSQVGGGTAGATALELEADHSVFHLKDLHISAVSPQQRTHMLI